MSPLTRYVGVDLPTEIGLVVVYAAFRQWLRTRIAKISRCKHGPNFLQLYLRRLEAVWREQRSLVGRILGVPVRNAGYVRDTGLGGDTDHHVRCASPVLLVRSGGHRPSWRRHRRGLHTYGQPSRRICDYQRALQDGPHRHSNDVAQPRRALNSIVRHGPVTHALHIDSRVSDGGDRRMAGCIEVNLGKQGWGSHDRGLQEPRLFWTWRALMRRTMAWLGNTP